jgi:hypothetical protein
MDYLRQDWHHATIAAWLNLSSEQVLAAVKYLEEHRAAVEAEYQLMLERDARGSPPEIRAKLEASQAKLEELLAERWQERAREARDIRYPDYRNEIGPGMSRRSHDC